MLIYSKKKTSQKAGFSKADLLIESTRQKIIADIPNMTSSQRIDPHQNVPTPKGAKISYLDARALEFWDKKRTDFKIPSYYSDSAFGRNVGPALRRLLDGGYLSLGDIRESINLKQVPELKAILTEHGLKVSGRKAELVQRLMDNISLSELESMFPVKVFKITDQGIDALSEYSLFFDNEHLSLGFSYYRLLQEKEKHPNASNDSIFVCLLANDINVALKAKDQESYRICVQKMARLLETIGRLGDSMQYHCLSFFMFWYRNSIELQIDGRPEAYGYIAKEIDDCGKMCGYSLDRTLQEFQQSLKTHNPFGLCTERNVNSAINVFKRAISVQ